MHVVMLVDALYEDVVGGSRVVARELARGLVARGHRVTFVAPAKAAPAGVGVPTSWLRCRVPSAECREPGAGSREPLLSQEPGAEVAVRRYSHRGPLDLIRQAARMTREVASEQRVDLIHVHFAYPAAGLSLRPIPGVPVVRTFYGSWAAESAVEARSGRTRSGVRVGIEIALRAKQSVEALSLRRSARVIVLSRFSRDEAVNDFGVSPERLTLVPGGVDLERFRPGDRGAARRRLGFPEGHRIVLTVRRLVPRMGLERLLEAMPAVCAVYPDLHLVIGGKGPLAGALQAQAERLGVADNVRLAGFLPDDDLATYYQAADLFVLPTIALEGFGLPTLEAMACGTPVLGTPVGATPELLAAVDPALVLPGATAEAIAEGMIAFLNAPARPTLAPDRLRAFAAGFSWDAVVERTLAVYRAALAQTDDRRPMTKDQRPRTKDQSGPEACVAPCSPGETDHARPDASVGRSSLVVGREPSDP
jgi:glycosyltransferase involved in cell wall biosynthesis